MRKSVRRGIIFLNIKGCIISLLTLLFGGVRGLNIRGCENKFYFFAS
jgi:hypothetical protein